MLTKDTEQKKQINGPQYFQTSSGKTSHVDLKSTQNMLLKEREDKRLKMNINVNPLIPSKENIGAVIQYRNDDERVDKISSERLDPTILTQLNNNPFIIKQ